MRNDERFALTIGILFGAVLMVLFFHITTHNVSKVNWSCTKVSQPQKLGEAVDCLQYTKDYGHE
jgi:hypothetical protein